MQDFRTVVNQRGHCAPAQLAGLPPERDTKRMRWLAAPLLALLACSEPAPKGWWCREQEQATKHNNGWATCERSKAACEGICEQKPLAYCYEHSGGRYCFSRGDMCEEHQDGNAKARSKCTRER